MRNLLIFLLAFLLVLAGAFLPEVLLKNSEPPQVEISAHEVVISSQSSSDYAWRLERIGEQYYGEGEHLMMTYISQLSGEEMDCEAGRLATAELNRMLSAGILPEQYRALLETCQNARIRYYYLFDSETAGGFRIAEYTAEGKNWNVFAVLDVESGKLVNLRYHGGTEETLSWYDVLRNFGSYLGLNTSQQVTAPELSAGGTREYYEKRTVDRFAARVSSGSSAWLEVRALKENNRTDVCVYTGGK